MLRRTIILAAMCGALAIPALPQDSSYGVSLPVTLSGAGMYTHRPLSDDPSSSPLTGGFRAMVYPTLQLGPNWFAYAAVQVRYTPYFYYDAFSAEREWYAETLQAFVGYTARTEKTTLVIKAGRLSSAFGSFPLHYDDADNPLLDQPLSYIQDLTLRHDQLPCGVRDLLWQEYGGVSYGCGGVAGSADGLTPVSLYGLPGVQAEFSGYRLDARLQITSGSPSNPLSLGHTPQYAQWTAGGGYTIRQGFRVGVSGFRGPYLDSLLSPLLPAGTTVRDFPASGLGVDVQWARGHWSLSGEWQRFQFDSPNFRTAPSVTSSYVETKRILTPRFYLAGRAGWLNSGRAADTSGVSTASFAPSISSYEFAAGCWLNRHQLIKTSYEWLKTEYGGSGSNVLGVQFVTTFHAFDRAFH